MRNGLKGLMAGGLTAIIGVVLGLTPVGGEFEQNLGLSALFQIRGPIPAPPEVVVLAITDQTGDSLGISKLPREWQRSVHARLVENLTQAGAAVIVFDMDFQLARHTEDDATFAKAVADSGRVVLVEKLVGKRQPLTNAEGKPVGTVWVEQLIPPLPLLAEAASGLGPFPVPKVQVAIHEFWAFKSSADSATMPAVAFQLLHLPIYPPLQRLLEKSGVTAPPPIGDKARAGELHGLMHDLRAVFSANPDLGNRLRVLLAADANPQLSSVQRQQLLALIALYEGGDNRLLNFYGPPGSIATLPYQLFAGEQKPDAGAKRPDLSGKTVFVGFSDLYDPGQPDRFYTVYSNDEGVDLSGVEIAATAFGNLLNNQSIHPLESFGELLILAGFGLAVGGIAYLLPAIAGVPMVILLSLGYGGMAVRLFSASQLWLPVAIPFLVQLPLALFNGLLTHYFLERRKRTKAIQAMGMYIPEHLAKDFTNKNLDESALNRVTYCVCFASDMAGFTSISEQLTPQALAAFLNDYFESLSAPLRKQGVDVVEFRADGIMCAWTATQPDAATRRKALLAALDAVCAIDAFKQSYPQFAHHLRIGLEAGMAYVGHAGGGGHFVYSIVGDCANTAARIEGLNKKTGTQILLSRDVLEGVEGLLTRYIGDFIFIGKTEPLAIYELVAEQETATVPQAKLCQEYRTAMELLRQNRILEAKAKFAALLQDFPNDGPTTFILAHCRQLIKDNSTENPTVIRLDSK